jgi:hypothetical protein
VVDQFEGVAFADVPGYEGAGGEDEDVALLGVFDFGGLVGGAEVEDLGVEAGLEGVEVVALCFEEFGGAGDVVGFGSAVGGYCLVGVSF